MPSARDGWRDDRHYADGMLRYGNLSIHPHTIRTLLISAALVTDYQVRQTGTGIDVAVAAPRCPPTSRIQHSTAP